MGQNTVLEILIGIYKVDEDIAKRESRRIRDKDFFQAVSDLEIAVCDENAATEILSRGYILKHIGKDFCEYLTLAREVAGKLNYEIGPEDLRIFDSINNLVAFKSGDTEKGLDVSNINPGDYKLLNSDIEKSAQYLNGLIENQFISVGINDHWKKYKTGGENGPRGNNILRKIGYEMRVLFDELELPPPTFNINYGKLTLEVNEDTAKVLRQIRDAVYNSD